MPANTSRSCTDRRKASLWHCVCVCVWERERERNTERIMTTRFSHVTYTVFHWSWRAVKTGEGQEKQSFVYCSAGYKFAVLSPSVPYPWRHTCEKRYQDLRVLFATKHSTGLGTRSIHHVTAWGGRWGVGRVPQYQLLVHVCMCHMIDYTVGFSSPLLLLTPDAGD